MTNEKFKALYEDALVHGWVTSKDPTKAAEQKKRQQEYNHRYYLKNKEKLNNYAKTGLSNLDRFIRRSLYDENSDSKRAIKNKQTIESLAQTGAAKKRNEAQKRKREQEEKRAKEAAEIRRQNAYAANIKRRENAAKNVNRKEEEEYSYMNAMANAEGRRKKAADKRAAKNRVNREVYQQNRSHYETQAREQNNKKRKSSTKSKVPERYTANAKRTTVESFRNNKSANEASAYAVARSLERQVRKQKRGQSSYPSKTTRRRTNIK